MYNKCSKKIEYKYLNNIKSMNDLS
jgi:hypothetical protein